MAKSIKVTYNWALRFDSENFRQTDQKLKFVVSGEELNNIDRLTGPKTSPNGAMGIISFKGEPKEAFSYRGSIGIDDPQVQEALKHYR